MFSVVKIGQSDATAMRSGSERNIDRNAKKELTKAEEGQRDHMNINTIA